MASAIDPARKLQEIDVELCLRNTLLFSDLSSDIVDIFVNNSTIKSFSKGRILFLHEEKAESFYVIVRGWVKLFRETLDGNEAVVDVLNEGQIFGETSIFEDGIHSCGAEIVEEAIVIEIPLSVFNQQIEQQPSLSMKMFSLMSRFRRQQDIEIEHRDHQNAPQRIGCFLLRLCKADDTGGISLHLPYDKTLIASRLGIKPETFSRALARLKEETGIKVHGSTIEITSIEQLSEYSCNACSSSYPCQDLH